jgi:hypothetical protein
MINSLPVSRKEFFLLREIRNEKISKQKQNTAITAQTLNTITSGECEKLSHEELATLLQFYFSHI